MIFEHYGNEHFNKEMFKAPLINGERVEALNKPLNGFWGSPVDSQNSWKNFCISEDYCVSSLDKHFKFRLKRFARILKVLNRKDLDSLYRKYGIKDQYDRSVLNWKEIVKSYDTMILIIPDDFDLLINLQLTSWDVDSVVVFNPNVVVELKDKAH